MNTIGKIALFGGTFDPIHNGHLALAEQARQVAGIDLMEFIPCRQSPHKSAAPTASAKQRCEMIDLAVENLAWAELSRTEIDRDSASFSWQTAEHFAKLYPSAGIYWILGTDQWSKIETWAEPDKLRDQLTFIVAMRNGDAIKSRPGWNHLPLTFDHPANATAIRSGDYDPAWLPDTVASCIKSQQIYS